MRITDCQSARDISFVAYGQELQSALTRAMSIVDKLATEAGEEAEQMKERLQTIIQLLKSAAHNLWTADAALFGIMCDHP